MSIPIFVYGTLRQKQPNWYRYLNHEGARFIGHAYTWPEFALVDLGGFPAMTVPDEKNKEALTTVIGEVYEVDSPTLRALDRLEGVPTFYNRMPIVLADGRAAQAYVLQANQIPEDAEPIKHGDWVRFQKERKR